MQSYKLYKENEQKVGRVVGETSMGINLANYGNY